MKAFKFLQDNVFEVPQWQGRGISNIFNGISVLLMPLNSLCLWALICFAEINLIKSISGNNFTNSVCMCLFTHVCITGSES